MVYILISTQIRLESGPTFCGDEKSDPELMKYLGASLTTEAGNVFNVYKCPDPPRLILDKLAALGFTVVGTTGVGQTIVWTLYSPSTDVALDVQTFYASKQSI